MSLFKRLFGGSSSQRAAPAVRDSAQPPNPKDPANDPNMIRAYDAYGREIFISKDQWRTKVLPGTIQTNWNKPDELYDVIVTALKDGFRADVIDAAEQLYKIDSDRGRGTCVWGIVLMEEGRLDGADKVFRDFMASHGEEGFILTNLAKVYSRRGNHAQAEELLWRGLQLDPNQDNGMGWYYAIHRERGGDAAAEEALRRIASVPRSWRAQLWLARAALQRRDLAPALSLYEQALASSGTPVPADLLMQMSGDLGNAGHLPELVDLTLPRFDVAFHGLQVGNNLIKAMLDLGQIEPARTLLQKLYAQNRMDWKKTLSFWDTELAKLHVATAPVEPSRKLSVAMLQIEGPIWLAEESPAHVLFQPPGPDASHICFLGSSAEITHKSEQITHQLSDKPGRLSRALPLFLTEQVRFHSNAKTRMLVPWIQSGPGGFVFSGIEWADTDAAHYARMSESPCDYLVVTHLRTKVEPWTAELRLIRTIDAKCLESMKAAFPSDQPGVEMERLADELLPLLERHADVTLTSKPECYSVPRNTDFPFYLLRLEQLLAVRCGGMDGVHKEFLSGEREIIDGNIHLCLNNAKNATTRILLLQTVKAMKRVRPEILNEYVDKLKMLQREHPLDQPAQAVCQHMLDEALTG